MLLVASAGTIQGLQCRGGNEMKLILAIVSFEDVEGLTEALLQADFRVTTLATIGGFLRRQHTTLLVGTEEGRVDAAMELIQANTRPHRARFPRLAALGTQEIGAATVFVLDIEASHRY
jgi:uncharacterized protein YaaQ